LFEEITKMQKNLFKKFVYIFFITIFVFLFQTCSDNSTNPQQNYISGTITFNNTAFYYSSIAYYAVSVFGDSTYPFTKAPIASDSIQITTSGGIATAYYKISNLAAGNYYIGVTWINKTSGSDEVLGTYGCDTIANCTSTIVTFPNYAGTGNLDFRSKTNIYAPLFHHP
jgi:hypothetical protein